MHQNKSAFPSPESLSSGADLSRVANQTPMLTAMDVAKLLKIGSSTLAALRKRGKFGPEPKRIGGSVRFVTSEVVQWIRLGCPDRAGWIALGGQTWAESAPIQAPAVSPDSSSAE
jgi:predicted DNA-binding transcriptional regulator AlpA